MKSVSTTTTFGRDDDGVPGDGTRKLIVAMRECEIDAIKLDERCVS